MVTEELGHVVKIVSLSVLVLRAAQTEPQLKQKEDFFVLVLVKEHITHVRVSLCQSEQNQLLCG